MSTHLVGESLPRVDGIGKTTGALKYAWDVSLPGMLWASVLRSPHPHARIVSVDVSRALRMPGVHSVLTGADVAGRRQGYFLRDTPVLAWDTVRFVGDRVAAVAAETIAQAEAALDAIDVQYEVLPAVFDPAAALAEDAPVLHPSLPEYHGVPTRDDRPNVFSVFRDARGDVQAGFAAADRVFEHTFRTQTQHQYYLEPHNCLVWIEDGRVHVWSSTKAPYPLRDRLAWTAGLEKTDIVVHITYCGGDFGGKGTILDEAVCYFLARAAGRPIRRVTSWTEELQSCCPRHPGVITLRTGVNRAGQILARSVEALFDSGAYAGFKPVPSVNLWGAYYSLGPYRISSWSIESILVYTNNVPRGHMRAPGSPQFAFAVESHTDLIAGELGLDPVEFRRRNLEQVGDIGALGRKQDTTAESVLKAVLPALNGFTASQPFRGVGIALAQYETGDGVTGCRLLLHADGTVRYVSGISDPGTGSRSLVRQLIADELGLALDAVDVQPVMTDDAPFDLGSGGSRVTHVAGRAVQQAAAAIREALLPTVEDLLECPAELIEWADGRYWRKGDRTRGVDVASIAGIAVGVHGGPIEGMAEYETEWPEENEYAAMVADVSVDPDTGQISVNRLTIAQDIGFAINPQQVESQIQGGVIQGLGMAMSEDLQIESGRVVNPSLGDYRVPCVLDTPPLDIILVEGGESPGPCGAKSVGELPVIPVAAAIANAVSAATGARIHDLPLTAEKVKSALDRGPERPMLQATG